MANEDAEQLREYLDKLNGLGVENDKFAKTRFLANKFKTLHLYLLLYKSLFAQFFSGLDGDYSLFTKYDPKRLKIEIILFKKINKIFFRFCRIRQTFEEIKNIIDQCYI